MWAPSDGLDCSLMFAKFESGFVVELFPHHQLIVITARSKLLIFVIPFEATNFLFVTHKFAKPLIRLPYVAVIDGAISRSRSQDVLVPCKGADASSVSCHGAETPLSLRIPNLHLASVRTNCNMRTLDIMSSE